MRPFFTALVAADDRIELDAAADGVVLLRPRVEIDPERPSLGAR